jgi:hypothetical protein
MIDTDEITFGKYNGTAIGKVPASYLLWLMGQRPACRRSLSEGGWDASKRGARIDPVHLYILENFHALETECPDRIIEHRP